MANSSEPRLQSISRTETEQQVSQLAKLVSATVGKEFFTSLIEHLAKALGGDYVYVAETVEGRLPRLRTVAVYRDGAAAEDFEQDLPGSSAGHVLTDGVFARSKDVRLLFPADPILEEHGAEAYVGVRLTDSAGQAIGLITLIARNPLPHVTVAQSVMGAFVGRAGAELERKRGEDALRESEERYRAFISRSSDAMWRIELAKSVPLDAPEEEQIDRIYRDGYLAECNEAMAQLAGARNAEELIGSQFSALFSESDSLIRQELRTAVQSRYNSATILTTPLGPNGKPTYRLRTQCGIVENNELRRIWGTTRDVTELKTAEMAVEASERRFREVLEKIQLPALMLSDRGELTFCNDALLRIANSECSLVGRNWLELIKEPRERAVWETLTSKEFAGSESHFHFEGALRFGDAAPRLLVWDAIVLRELNGEAVGLAAIATDITDQRLLQSRLAQAEKLDGIGRLAAGIAHDFNDLLTLIMGYVELGLGRAQPATPLHKTLVSIQSAANDCAVLTHQLLAIGRRQHLRSELLNVNSVIAAEEDTIRQIIGPDIEFVTDMEPSVGLTWADPVQIRRILNNLATNSRDAMPKGGTLTIATANVAIGTEASRADAPAGEYVRLAVTDTGIGFSEEVKKHLFEPFFTTKAAGKGRGLGLTTIYGIVTQSGGYISARSPGTGTIIEILFPRYGMAPPDAQTSA